MNNAWLGKVELVFYGLGGHIEFSECYTSFTEADNDTAVTEWELRHTPDGTPYYNGCAQGIDGHYSIFPVIESAAGMKTMPMTTWVAQYRKELGLSIRALSRRSGVDRRTITKVEAGYHPSSRVLDALSRVLGDGLCKNPPLPEEES